jgi:PAS domain S-box-containing protein
MKILYVEDDPFDADLTRRALSKSAPHISLDIARTQSEALELLQSNGVYDLLLTDLRLPDGSGFTLLSHVRDRGLLMAVVVITGQGDEEIAVSVLKAGANDYLVKRQDYLDHLALTLENARTRYFAEVARRERPLRVLYLESNPDDSDLARNHFASHAPHIHLDIVQTDTEMFQRLPGPGEPVEHEALLVDYRWQDLNALDLLKELRQVRGLDLPILLVAERGDEEIAAQALRLGASDYLVKNPGYLHRLPGLLENAYHRAQLLREQAALRASEERFRRLAENAPDIIYRFRDSANFAIEYVSPAVLAVTGYTPEDFLSDPSLALKVIHPDDLLVLDNMLKQGLPPSTPFNLRIIRKDGTLVWMEGRNVPIYDSAGNLVAHEGILRDISERKKAEENIQRQLQRLNALRTVDTAISASLDLRVTLNVLLENVVVQLGVHAADILVYNPNTQLLEYSAGIGFHSAAIDNLKLRLGESFAGRAVRERRTIRLPDEGITWQASGPSTLVNGEDFVTYYGTPLIAKGKVKGVMEVYHRLPMKPDAEWMNFFETLAGQAAIAIDSAELLESLQRANLELTLAYDNTLEGWVRALDLREKETHGHTQRVTEITISLARQMGMSEASLSHIRRGALLHDIGKIAIPDSILLKPGPLTDEEWVTMRLHPVYAHDLLSPVEYLRQALEIPYNHHEKWNGTGYPRSLKGDQIPLAARIFAVVDVWDALNSDRPYRPRWERERALEYIRDQSGEHFDPIVAERFFSLLPTLPL